MISVILPLLHEGSRPLPLLKELAAQPDIECIVVEGEGSEEDFRILQSLPGIRLFRAPRPRANQLNFGAAQAQGELLFFLHADSSLPQGWKEEIEQILNQPRRAGAFAFALDTQGFAAWLTQKGANLRSRYLGLSYGDQGLFISREFFNQLGGFASMEIMEDFEFVRRIRQQGALIHSKLPLCTSSRRYQRIGFWPSFWRNQWIVLRYLLQQDLSGSRRLYGPAGEEGKNKADA